MPQDWHEPATAFSFASAARFVMECTSDEPLLSQIRQKIFRGLAAGFCALAAYYFWQSRYPEETNTSLMWCLSICIGVGGVSLTMKVVKFVMRVFAKGIHISFPAAGDEDDE